MRAVLVLALFAVPLGAAPVPRAERHDGLLCLAVVSTTTDARLLLFTPDGKQVKEVKLPDEAVFFPVLSRDGTRAAVFLPTDEATLKARAIERVGWAHGRVAVFDLDKPKKPLAVAEDLFAPHPVWSPDGKTLYVSSFDATVPRKAEGWDVYPWQSVTLDVATGKQSPLGLPQGHVVVSALPDNDTLFTGQQVVKGGQWVGKPYLVPLATKKPELMTEKTRPPGVPAVNDSMFADVPGRGADEPSIPDPICLNVRAAAQEKLKLGNDTVRVRAVRWSPDGKRVLVHRVVKLPGRPERLVQEVAVRDVDGTNPKVVYELKADEYFTGVDWK